MKVAFAIIFAALGTNNAHEHPQEHQLFAKSSKAKEAHPSAKASKHSNSSGGGGCSCDGDTEYIFNPDELTWWSHYMVAKNQGCEMASITNSNEQFQAISAAALGWQLQDEETTLEIKAVWIGGKRIKAEGGGRNVDGSVDESPWRWSDGSTWDYTNWNYNEPTDGRYCEENDTFCYENRVVMQVIKQVYPLADINGNPDITLSAGDWHDDPGNLLFPGLYKCCFAYQCNAVVGDDSASEEIFS